MLLNAGVRLGGGPMRTMGGAAASAIERARWGAQGSLRNFHAGEATVISGAGISAKAGYPTGCLAPASWSLPNKAGGMSSRFAAGLSIAATGLAVGGVNISGSSAMSFAATAAGQLIAFGQGTAAMTFGATGTMAGTVQASGAAAFAFTASGLLGALAGGSGTAAMTFGATGNILPADDTPPARTALAAMTFSATANILPADDTPPARTALAAMAFSATAILRAIGHMSGSTDVSTELTAAAIAAEVLAAAAASPIAANVEQVRGQALEGAGTSGDPWGPA